MATFLIWISVLCVFTIKMVHSQPNVDVTFKIHSITEYTLLYWGASDTDFTGITYTLSIEPGGPVLENVSGEGSVFSIAGSINITGLRPGAEYNITVIFSDSVGTQNIKMYPFNAAPEEVASFDLDADGYDITLTWTEPLVKNGRIRNYTLTYVGSKENVPMIEESRTISPRDSLCELQYCYTLTNLPTGHKYVFTIRAVTIIAGAPKDIHYFYIREPSIGDVYLDNPEAMKPVVNAAPSATELSVSMVNPFTDRNYDIVGYSVIVATSTTQPGNDSTLLNWSEAKAVLFKKPFIAIYKCPDLFDKNSECVRKTTKTRRKRAAGDRIDIEIGADTQCAQNSEEYCNGELEPHSAYFILLRAYAETGLYTDTPFSDVMITAQQEASSITTTIVASVVSFVVGGALVGLIVFCVFRLRGRTATQDYPNSKPTDETIEYEIASENVTRTNSVPQKATGNVPYGDIPIKPILSSTEDAKSQYMSLDKPIYYENVVDDSSEYYNNPKQSTTKEPAQYQELQYKN